MLVYFNQNINGDHQMQKGVLIWIKVYQLILRGSKSNNCEIWETKSCNETWEAKIKKLKT